MSMSADTAHRFWLGEVNITVALARGEIKRHGAGAEDAAGWCRSPSRSSPATGLNSSRRGAADLIVAEEGE